MTLAEFQDIATEGVVVECITKQQRKSVLELFDENGFRIGSASRVHLGVSEKDFDTEYMHPGYEPHRGYVSCYRNFERVKSYIGHGIKYDDIKDAIENPQPLDKRNDAEFADDFAALMC